MFKEFFILNNLFQVSISKWEEGKHHRRLVPPLQYLGFVKVESLTGMELLGDLNLEFTSLFGKSEGPLPKEYLDLLFPYLLHECNSKQDM